MDQKGVFLLPEPLLWTRSVLRGCKADYVSFWVISKKEKKRGFFKKNYKTQVLFMGTLYFGLLVTFALGFKARVDPFASFLACVILRFTSGATPADCIGVSMAVEPF